MENRKTRVALYSRVSTNKQTNANQIHRLVDYAKQKGVEFDLYEEVESSRKTRPVKQDLLKKLRNGEYDSVVVYKLDRWARSSTELILEIQELLDKKIGFFSVSDNLDFNSSMGRLHFHILSAFADFERALISERTKASLARIKLQGVKLGRPKGSKDSKPRPKSGYYVREANKRKDKKNNKGE